MNLDFLDNWNYLFSVPDATTFDMLVFHFQFGGKVFSVNLPPPVWWEMFLISFFGLMDPEHIGLVVEIAFLSRLQADI